MLDSHATRQSLSTHLQTLTREQITALLTGRRDVTVTPAPKTIPKLAERLLEPGSLRGALTVLTLPQLQAAEAVAALGDGCTPQQLAALLGVPEEAPTLRAVLAELAGLALTWPHAGGLAGDHLDTVWPQPLGLGPGAGELLDGRNLPDLRRVAKTLGVPAGRTRAEVIAALVSWLADHDNVRRLAEQAPADIHAGLAKLARESPAAVGYAQDHLQRTFSDAAVGGRPRTCGAVRVERLRPHASRGGTRATRQRLPRTLRRSAAPTARHIGRGG